MVIIVLVTESGPNCPRKPYISLLTIESNGVVDKFFYRFNVIVLISYKIKKETILIVFLSILVSKYFTQEQL